MNNNSAPQLGAQPTKSKYLDLRSPVPCDDAAVFQAAAERRSKAPEVVTMYEDCPLADYSPMEYAILTGNARPTPAAPAQETSALTILPDTDPRLGQVCFEVIMADRPTKALIKEMQELRISAKGAGLAAPQVGILRRFIVIDPQYCPGLMLGVMINPKIIKRNDECSYELEGCLSSGDRRERIKRNTAVQVEFTNFAGHTVSRWFYNFAARLMQHEIDHLDGIRFIDHL